MIWHERSSATKAALKLLRYQVSPTTFHVPHKPYCDEPVPLTLSQRAGKTSGVYVEMFGPCRKCEKCLLFRRLKWRDRITVENRSAPRSWFVTLTFSPIHLAGIIAKAYTLDLPIEAATERVAYTHVQGYLDRLRKSCGSFRYVAIPEYGEENGRLHYHLIIHEKVFGSVLHRQLNQKWRSHVSASLVKDARGSGTYLSKYLTKSFSRVRASAQYGKTSVPLNGFTRKSKF